MTRAVTFAAFGLLCGFVTPCAQGATNLQTQAQCKQVISAMAEDIAGLKTNFTELANFAPTNPVVFGNAIPVEMQLQGLRITYFHNFEYIKGPDKTQSYYRPKPGGCILNIQLFPDGDSWAGFRVDKFTRNLDRRASKTGVRLQASIQTQNKELAARLERIIIDRFKAVE